MSEKRTLVSFDWALKSILRKKDNFDVLEGFLSAVLEDDIKIIDLLESESNKRHEIDKSNRVDLKAKDSKGREIIIEVQNSIESDYLDRMYYGTAKALIDKMYEGYDYDKITKIISISIVYFDFMQDSYFAKIEPKCINISNPEKEVTGLKTEKLAEYYFIQPKKFKDEIKKSIDEWVYMFKHSDVKDNFKSKSIDKAKEILNFEKMTKKEQEAYADYNTSVHIAENMIKSQVDEAKKEKAIEIAKKMILENEPINKIINYTELSEEEIIKIKIEQ